jgi:hypothetical protein
MEKLDAVHWLLAFAGLAVHVLMKLAESPGNFFNSFTKKDILVLLASTIAIPAILIICTDTSLSELLPINYVTSFFSWLSNSIFFTIFQ